MRAVVQRVTQASVIVNGETYTAIDHGLLVLLGITHADTLTHARALADKIVHLRIFPDDQGKMNLDLQAVSGAMLIVSQFTLYGDCQKGRRPSFVNAAKPEQAEPLYVAFIHAVMSYGVTVKQGVFGADMQVHLTNNGPVTLIVEMT